MFNTPCPGRRRSVYQFRNLAGFDAVEVHGANGYLLDEFLRDGTNKRTDSYGGSIKNRSKLLLETTEAIISVFGPERVGVRISPLNSYIDMRDSDPICLTKYVAFELSNLKISYLHLFRGDFFGIQKGDVLSVARKNFKGTIISNGGYSPDEADDAIASGSCDAVAFGSLYISNPDLVARIKNNYRLAAPDPKTFYIQSEKGYTDYPVYS